VTGRFDSKVILVTGGTSGIGLAVATRVAAEGGAVVLAGRRADVGERAAGEIEAGGGRARFVAADVTDEAQVRGLVDVAVGELGRLDGAFNNAGDAGGGGPLAQVAAEDWDAELARNLTSVLYCLKAEIPAILAGGAGGSIVNNASIAAVAGIPGLAAYTAAKHGVVGLTRSAALEPAPGRWPLRRRPCRRRCRTPRGSTGRTARRRCRDRQHQPGRRGQRGPACPLSFRMLPLFPAPCEPGPDESQRSAATRVRQTADRVSEG
jgi:NADP-dependent 3-hydroxy acid dehydrogenase YdfG